MKSIIIGAGTYGEVYLAYLQEVGVEIIGFVDDNPKLLNSIIRGIPVLGGVSMLETLKETHNVEAVYCPIGNNKLRVKFLSLASRLGYITPNFIHSSALISPNVDIADSGVYIFPKSTIMPWTKIEKYVMISVNVVVAHHVVLQEGVFLSTGVNFGASILAKKYAYCGIGSVIMTGIETIGEDALVGAGAVVIRDVEDFAVVAGVPAKIIKYKNQ